jgi:hypothetical protein
MVIERLASPELGTALVGGQPSQTGGVVLDKSLKDLTGHVLVVTTVVIAVGPTDIVSAT